MRATTFGGGSHVVAESRFEIGATGLDLGMSGVSEAVPVNGSRVGEHRLCDE